MASCWTPHTIVRTMALISIGWRGEAKQTLSARLSWRRAMKLVLTTSMDTCALLLKYHHGRTVGLETRSVWLRNRQKSSCKVLLLQILTFTNHVIYSYFPYVSFINVASYSIYLSPARFEQNSRRYQITIPCMVSCVIHLLFRSTCNPCIGRVLI